jgi:hypothetical protein
VVGTAYSLIRRQAVSMKAWALRGAAVWSAAEDHQQFVHLFQLVRLLRAVGGIPQMVEDRLQVGVEGRVSELPVRDVVDQALNQVPGVLPWDPTLLEQLGLKALEAADDLLVAPTRRGVLPDSVVVVLLGEVVDLAAALGEQALADHVLVLRVVAVQLEAGDRVGVERVGAGGDVDRLVASGVDQRRAELSSQRPLDPRPEVGRRHRIGRGGVVEEAIAALECYSGPAVTRMIDYVTVRRIARCSASRSIPCPS